MESNIWFVSYAFPGGFGSMTITYNAPFSAPSSDIIQHWVNRIAEATGLDESQIVILFFSPITMKNI